MKGRTYLKEPKGSKKEVKFIMRLDKLGALYYDKEDDILGGIIVINKKYGDEWLAVKLYIDGRFQFGDLDKSCNNFDCNSETYYKSEMKWLHTLFGKILNR